MSTELQYLAQATCVISFAPDREIRYKVADIERAFQSVVGGQATGTNVADTAPPSIPRFTMQGGPKQLSISQVSAQLDLDFSGQKKSFESLSPTIKKNINNFWLGVCAFKSRTEIRDMGLIVTINIPSKLTMSQLSAEICNRYIRAPMQGDVVSTSLQVGLLDTDKRAFINITLGAYEMRQGRIDKPVPTGGGSLTIEMESLPIIECGIEAKFDVNSKPMAQKNAELPIDLDDQLFKRVEDLLNDRYKEFLTW
jgi:hypothetical protein